MTAGRSQAWAMRSANRKMANEIRLERLAERRARALRGGGTQRIDAQHERGKLTARAN